MDQLLQDLRFALRALVKRPAFTAAVLLTLALGIAASTAIFSLLNATLLRPLPFDEPERIVFLAGVAGPERAVRFASMPEALDWARENRTLESVAITDNLSLNLRVGDEAVRVQAEMVSRSYFDILGAEPVRGRTFLPEEDATPGTHPVAVLGHGLWSTRFGADPGIIGRSITLDELAYTVVGVMPQGFGGIGISTELWVPSMMVTVFRGADAVTTRGSRWLGAIGRLDDRVTIEAAQRDLDAVAARLSDAFPASNTDRGVQLMTLTELYLGNTETLLQVLFVAVLLFLLIACANVTSLQLVRATARNREIAVRVAMGAGRPRLVRQMLTEGALIAVLGGAAGVIFAWWGIEAFRPLIPAGLLPAYAVPSLDLAVLGFALLLSLGCGVIFGLVPALRSTSTDLTGSLKEGARTAHGGLGRRPTLQQGLVVAEVALALVLLIGAGLVVRSFRQQLAVDPGMRVEDVFAASVDLPGSRYATADAQRAFVARLTERLAAIPGVEAAAIGSDAPLRGGTSASMLALPARMDEEIRYYRHRVTPGFFEALRIPVLAGRVFTERDGPDAPLVVVLSEAGASRLFPDENPVGRRIAFSATTTAEVIGIVANARFRDLTTTLETTEPDVYYAFAQRTAGGLELVVRSRLEPSTLLPSVRAAVRELDPTLPIYAESPLGDALRSQTAAARFGSAVLGTFSVVALLLAAIGIYGVLSFLVGASRREIAIRMALGAAASRVLGLVVRRGLVLAIVGLVLGLGGALLASGALASQLFGVDATDPFTYVVVSTTLLGVALLASWLPARRAMRIEPQDALKGE
jgi:predicted permease